MNFLRLSLNLISYQPVQIIIAFLNYFLNKLPNQWKFNIDWSIKLWNAVVKRDPQQLFNLSHLLPPLSHIKQIQSYVCMFCLRIYLWFQSKQPPISFDDDLFTLILYASVPTHTIHHNHIINSHITWSKRWKKSFFKAYKTLRLMK